MYLASIRPDCVSVPSRAKKGCTTVWYHNRAKLQEKHRDCNEREYSKFLIYDNDTHTQCVALFTKLRKYDSQHFTVILHSVVILQIC